MERYQGNHKIQIFLCSQQFRCMAIAQLTQRSSLREIETCLRAHGEKLYHLGLPMAFRKALWQKPMRKETGASTPNFPND